MFLKSQDLLFYAEEFCPQILSNISGCNENSEKDRPLKGPQNILTGVEFYAVFCSVAQGVHLSPFQQWGKYKTANQCFEKITL